MEQEKEQRIEAVLNSLEGIQRASMPPGLRDRIFQCIPEARKRIVMLKKPTIWLMAAGLALLMGLNIYSLIAHTAGQEATVTVQGNPIATEYFTPPPSI